MSFIIIIGINRIYIISILLLLLFVIVIYVVVVVVKALLARQLGVLTGFAVPVPGMRGNNNNNNNNNNK